MTFGVEPGRTSHASAMKRGLFVFAIAALAPGLGAQRKPASPGDSITALMNAMHAAKTLDMQEAFYNDMHTARKVGVSLTGGLGGPARATVFFQLSEDDTLPEHVPSCASRIG